MAKTILFQGDSITDAGRYKNPDRLWDLNHHLGQGYVFMITGELLYRAPEKDLNFINRGISGNRITDLYPRWKSDTIRLAPDILSILIGVNDCWHEVTAQNGVEPDKYERTYRLLLDEVKEKLSNTKLVILEPFVLPVGTIKESWAQYQALILPIQKIAEKIAKEYDAVWIPLQDKLNALCKIKPAAYWLWDGVHPTPAGHRLIADEWLRLTKHII